MVILLMEVFGVGLDCFFGIVFMVGFILLGILDCYWMVMINYIVYSHQEIISRSTNRAPEQTC